MTTFIRRRRDHIPCGEIRHDEQTGDPQHRAGNGADNGDPFVVKSAGLDRREALFARKPAALTAEERREAIAALLRIGEDSLTPGAINDTLMGCGIRARATEKADRSLKITFPGIIGIPAEFDQIQKIILDILPCHLAVEFFFRQCQLHRYRGFEIYS